MEAGLVQGFTSPIMNSWTKVFKSASFWHFQAHYSVPRSPLIYVLTEDGHNVAEEMPDNY
jgi:hypothetical protein